MPRSTARHDSHSQHGSPSTGSLAVEDLGQDPRRRRLARAARPGEQVGLALAAGGDGVAQRPHDVVLALQLGEPARAVAAVERRRGHGADSTEGVSRLVRETPGPQAIRGPLPCSGGAHPNRCSRPHAAVPRRRAGGAGRRAARGRRRPAAQARPRQQQSRRTAPSSTPPPAQIVLKFDEAGRRHDRDDDVRQQPLRRARTPATRSSAPTGGRSPCRSSRRCRRASATSAGSRCSRAVRTASEGSFSFEVLSSPTPAPDDSTPAARPRPAAARRPPRPTAPDTADGDAVDSSSTCRTPPTCPTGRRGWAGCCPRSAWPILFGSFVLIVVAWPEGPEYILAVRFLRSVWILDARRHAALRHRPQRGGQRRVARQRAQSRHVARPARRRLARPRRDRPPRARGRDRLGRAAPGARHRPDDPAAGASPSRRSPCATIGLARTGGDLAVLGVVAGIVHAIAMAIWFGGVVLLARVVLAGPGEEDLVQAVRGFGRISGTAIVFTVVSGLVQLYRLDGGSLFSEPHGRVLARQDGVRGDHAVRRPDRPPGRPAAPRAGRPDLSPPTADRLRRAFGTEAVDRARRARSQRVADVVHAAEGAGRTTTSSTPSRSRSSTPRAASTSSSS